MDVTRRPNRFQVDTKAIAHNIAEIRRIAGPTTRIFAPVKANAYGFGLPEIADAAISAGADALALVEVSDALRIRQRGIRQPILIYAGNLLSRPIINAIEEFDLTPTLVDLEGLEAYSRSVSRPTKAFVKVDVGLERNGGYPRAAIEVIRAACRVQNIQIEGIYAHLHVPSSRESSLRYVKWQHRRFVKVIASLEADGIHIPIQMLASSSVILTTRNMMLNAVDPGHLIYGLLPPGQTALGLPLKPAFAALRTWLVQVKTPCERSEFMGDAPIDLQHVRRYGIVPFGSADGMSRLNCGEVLVHGRRVRILGAPSLEHTRVDLTEIPDARSGDDVVVIGGQGSAEISPAEVMAYQGMDRQTSLALEVRHSVAREYVS